jgi:hypothetical protein
MPGANVHAAAAAVLAIKGPGNDGSLLKSSPSDHLLTIFHDLPNIFLFPVPIHSCRQKKLKL